jgi:3-isopropylmalate/(R)-2-methylmalate dehydratase small subunit
MKTDASITRVSGRAVPVRGSDIDTDRIIPARYLKLITFEDLGPAAFRDERFDEQDRPKPHPFNDERFRGFSILLANRNFGCGSSREHAPQALYRAGVRAIIGESFAEIFAGNCAAIGLPAVICSPVDVSVLMDAVERRPALELTVDLVARRVSASDGSGFGLSMPEAYRNSLIEGTWDSTAVLLANREAIMSASGRLPPAVYGA